MCASTAVRSEVVCVRRDASLDPPQPSPPSTRRRAPRRFSFCVADFPADRGHRRRCNSGMSDTCYVAVQATSARHSCTLAGHRDLARANAGGSRQPTHLWARTHRARTLEERAEVGDVEAGWDAVHMARGQGHQIVEHQQILRLHAGGGHDNSTHTPEKGHRSHSPHKSRSANTKKNARRQEHHSLDGHRRHGGRHRRDCRARWISTRSANALCRCWQPIASGARFYFPQPYGRR